MKKYLKQDWFLYIIFIVVVVVIATEVMTGNNSTQPIIFDEEHPDYWIAPSLYSDDTT